MKTVSELQIWIYTTFGLKNISHILNIDHHDGHKQALYRFIQVWEKEKCGKIQMGGVMKLVLTFVPSSQEQIQSKP